MFSHSAWAMDFIGLWMTADQQGRYYYQRNEFTKAANTFENSMWKGLSYYAAQDFISAAATFSKIDSPHANFYLANSLEHEGKLQDAVDTYQKVLNADPNTKEATFNLDWVQGILELEQKQYDDVGGTGGKLKADKFVFDDKAKQAKESMTVQQAQIQGLNDQQLEEMWMRRVQTTPGDFLQFKFYYQLLKQTESKPE